MALSNKQKIFVERYLTTWNATEAAIAAGYSAKSAANIGYVNVRKDEIAEAIRTRLSESAMSADEVLMRLAEHGRGSMGDFWDIPADGDPSLDLTSETAKAKLHLIKKLKVKKTTRAFKEAGEDVTELTTEVEFELYDAQAALEKIGRHHKLFTDRIDNNVSGETIVNLRDASELSDDDLARIAAGRGG